MNILSHLIGSKRITSSPDLALFYKSHNKAIILQQILFWHGKSNKKDGWFYITKKDLGNQLAMTEDQIKYNLNELKKKNHIIVKAGKSKRTQQRFTWININWEVFQAEFQEFLSHKNIECYDEEPLPDDLPSLPERRMDTGKGEITRWKGAYDPLEKVKSPERKGEIPSTLKEHTELHTDQIYKGFNFTRWPSKPSEDVFTELIALRKRHKLSNSDVAFNTIGAQITLAAKSGHTVDQCIAQWITSGWKSFKAEYMTGKNVVEEDNAKKTNNAKTHQMLKDHGYKK